MASSKMPTSETKDENIWQELLRKASGKKTILAPSTLLVVGDLGSGKSTLLSRFADRCQSESHEYLFNFSFLDVKNKRSTDRDEVISRMHVYNVDDAGALELLPLVESALPSMACLVALSLAEPWATLRSLETWLEALHTYLGRLTAELPPDEQSRLRRRVSEHVQMYGSGEEKMHPPQLDLNVPARNLGVPVVVVACQADLFARNLPGSKAQQDDAFEFLTVHLRKICREWGAALVITSTTPTNKSMGADVAQDYIIHRLHGLPLEHKATVVASTSSPFVFAPAGLDERVLDHDPVVKKWIDASPDKLLPNPRVKQSERRHELITAKDNAEFFRNFQFNQEHPTPVFVESGKYKPGSSAASRGPTKPTTVAALLGSHADASPAPNPSTFLSTPRGLVPPPSAGAAEPASERVVPSAAAAHGHGPQAPSTPRGTSMNPNTKTDVKEFFRTLLKGGSTKEGRTRAKNAIEDLQKGGQPG